MKKTLLLLFLINLSAYSQEIKNVTASSSIWNEQKAIDKDKNSVWSSDARVSSLDVEDISITFTSPQNINYIKVFPRYINKKACGFPKSFDIKYRSGQEWITIRSETNFPQAERNEYIILPFPKTVETSAILFITRELGKDDVGNNIFQLAEFEAGFEQDFKDNFLYVSNNSRYKSNNVNEIRNVGSDSFDPNKLNVWHYDIRKPLMDNMSAPNYYSPSIVKNGDVWNIYYGGFDYANFLKDNIYLTASADNFLTFKGKAHVISNVQYEHANNCSVIKEGDNDWKMLYTAYPLKNKNKPHYGKSTNGLNWNFNNPVTMSNYPAWDQTNSDGGNVLFSENGLYHMFFTDYNHENQDFRVHHATSRNFVDYKYKGVAQNKERIATDLKSFDYNNNKHYLLGTHRNTNNVELTVSTDLDNFDNPTIPTITLNNSSNPNDKFIATLGFVEDENSLKGYLYGSSSVTTLNNNKIYANWLQKKVIFKNDHVRWGDVEEAYGPDRIALFMSTQVETGKFYIYDSDGTTLLYTSPLVTMKSGDIWDFVSTDQAALETVVSAPLNETPNESQGKVYPNPAKNSISIAVDEPISKVEIYTILGGLVTTIETTKNKIAIESLISGTYVLKAYTKNGIHDFKFIKN